MYVGGVIKDFSRNAKAIAHTFGYSERTLRSYVAYLHQRGYLSKPTRHDISLRSRSLLTAEYGVSKYCYKVSTNDLHKLAEIIQALAIQEGLDRQQYRIKEKLKTAYLRQNGKLCSSLLQPAAQRRALRGFDVAKEQAFAQARFTEQVQRLQESKSALVPFVTYSRQGLAKCFGRKSKTTGLRRAKKLIQAGVLSEKAHTIAVNTCTYAQFRAMQVGGLGYDPSYRFDKGHLIKVMPNLLTIHL